MMKDETALFGWRFDNSYSRLPAAFYSRVNPTPVAEPRLVLVNRPLAQSLGLDPTAFTQPQAAAFFAGNMIFPGAEPIAQAYAGHQYGNLVRLGDGRAILLGEHVTADGRRFDIQLKGSGPTPYSRRGDGRAALGPMLREYLISEAMHALGIPTTRSLVVATTGEPVFREQPLPGAVLTRIAASHTIWHRRWTERLARQPQPSTEVVRLMNANNPAVIPRNHEVEDALAAAVAGDLKPLEQLLEALARPYEEAGQPGGLLNPPLSGTPVCRTFCGT